MVPKRDSGNQLDALQLMLTSANELTSGLLSDPLVPRILQAFARLPEPDREPILRIIERDAAWCRIVEHTVDSTGVAVRPNPAASLYLHVVNPHAAEPLQRDVDVIRFGIETFVQLLPLMFQEGVHEQWSASARALARHATPDNREYAARMAREVLEIVAEANAAS